MPQVALAGGLPQGTSVAVGRYARLVLIRVLSVEVYLLMMWALGERPYVCGSYMS